MKKIHVILFIIFLLPTIAFALQYTTEQPQGYGIGDEVSNFQLKNIDGTTLDLYNFLEEQKARGAVIVFMSNTCPYAIATEERLIAFDQKYKNKGFPVVAINSNVQAVVEESFLHMQKRASQQGYSYPYLADDEQTIATTFGAKRTPHVFIIQKDAGQKVRLKYIGAFDDYPMDAKKVTEAYVVDALKALIKNKPITQTEVKAIGCGIKWLDVKKSTSSANESSVEEGYATSKGEEVGGLSSAKKEVSCCAGNSKPCCKAKAQNAALNSQKKKTCTKAQSKESRKKACQKSKKQKSVTSSSKEENTTIN